MNVMVRCRQRNNYLCLRQLVPGHRVCVCVSAGVIWQPVITFCSRSDSSFVSAVVFPRRAFDMSFSALVISGLLPAGKQEVWKLHANEKEDQGRGRAPVFVFILCVCVQVFLELRLKNRREKMGPRVRLFCILKGVI